MLPGKLKKTLVDGFSGLLFDLGLQKRGCSCPWLVVLLPDGLLVIPIVRHLLVVTGRGSCPRDLV